MLNLQLLPPFLSSEEKQVVLALLVRAGLVFQALSFARLRRFTPKAFSFLRGFNFEAPPFSFPLQTNKIEFLPNLL